MIYGNNKNNKTASIATTPVLQQSMSHKYLGSGLGISQFKQMALSASDLRELDLSQKLRISRMISESTGSVSPP